MMKVFACAVLTMMATTALSYSYSPDQLVNAAYNSRIDGIPGFNGFCEGEKRPASNADEIIEAGIAEGFVDADVVDDRYINSVRRLSRLTCLDIN